MIVFTLHDDVVVMLIQQESSDDEGSDDTEGTLTHPISSSDSESDGDDVESLASSVAELSSGLCLVARGITFHCALL